MKNLKHDYLIKKKKNSSQSKFLFRLSFYEGLVINSRKLQEGRLTDLFSDIFFFDEANLFMISNRENLQDLATFSQSGVPDFISIQSIGKSCVSGLIGMELPSHSLGLPSWHFWHF